MFFVTSRPAPLPSALALLLAGLLPVLAGPCAHAQSPIVLESPNAMESGNFGASVASAGDLNGDGASDVIVGAPGEDVGEKSSAGRVYVLGGADGSVLQTITAPTPTSLADFGQTVAGTRLDGTPYILVRSSGAFSEDGRFYLFDASNGSFVQTYTQLSFESVIAPAGDLDNDGMPDVLVGNPAATTGGTAEAGSTSVISGADGSSLLGIRSPNAEEEGHFGAAVAGGSDVNGDGTPDVIVGAPDEERDTNDGTGRAYLIDGSNGNVLRTLSSQYDGGVGAGRFGAAVAPLSDLNGDGTPDFTVGASSEDVLQEDPVHIFGVAGRVHLISGADGTILRTLAAPPSTALGRTVAAVGDLNADGTDDVIAGAPGTDISVNQGGPVYAFSGADGREIDSLGVQSSKEDPRFGFAIAGAGDTDGDGLPDLIVGDERVDTDAGSRAGRTYLYSGADLSLAARSSQSVSSNGTVDFGATGVDVTFSDVSGSGPVTVEKFDTPPSGTGGVSESNVSDYRFVIEAGGDLSFGSGTEVRFDASTLGGVTDPDAVTVYTRSSPGEGSFSELTTTHDASELVATTGSFSEFVFASDANPLPVTLAGDGLKAQATGSGDIRLSWKTLSEENNARFIIERQVKRRQTRASGSAGAWTKVTSVESKSEGHASTGALRYRVTDKNAPFEAQKLTYRLVQHDWDGGQEVLVEQVVEVGAPRSFALHAVYPTPMRSRATVTVHYELPTERPVTVALYDALGRKVRTLVNETQRGRQKVTFEAEGLASGVYFVRMTARDFTASRKVVLVR